jgi:hypothetical protein
MQHQTISALRTAQPHDPLRIALRSGRPIAVDFLAVWRKPEIADLCDGRKTVRTRYGYAAVPRDWRKSELALKERFGGILLSKTARELVKSQALEDDAPLFDWIMCVLNVAWALYSRAVFQEGYRRAFEDYVRHALMHEPRFNSGWINMVEAAQALRLSLGLPRFNASETVPIFPRRLSSRGLPPPRRRGPP